MYKFTQVGAAKVAEPESKQVDNTSYLIGHFH